MAIVSSCGSSQQSAQSENPLLEDSWDTPFGIAPFERIEAHHFLAAFDLAIAEQRTAVERIVNSDDEVSFEGVVWALDNSGIRFNELKDLFEMNEAAISSPEYREVSDELAPRITAAVDSIYMNKALFDKVERLYNLREQMELDAQQLRLVEKYYTRFVRGGAKLPAAQKIRLAQVNSEIASLCSKFSQNLLAENDAFYLSLESDQLEGLTSDMRVAAKEEAKCRGLESGWVISLNPSSMIPFLTYSTQRDLREKIYKAYLQRGANGGETDNRDIVRKVSELRQERAQMLGYKNHADYVISQQMAGSVEAAYALLEDIWKPALEGAKRERDDLQRLLELDVPGAKLESWDWWYYAEKLREDRYNLNSASVAQYFALEGVRGGVFTLANRLYGLAFRPVDVPIYNDDCVAFEVFDQYNKHLGILYFDLYARSGKGQGAWCGNLREQRTDGGDRITPVVAIVCNFARPTASSPTLLTMEQVETLFHEFGHALHFLFQNVDYHGLAAVEGDFVEFPSQVMENWAFEPEFLAMYATHFRSGQPISDLFVKRIQESKRFNQGYETLSVAAAALLDLDLQTNLDFDDFNVDRFEFESLVTRRGMISQIEPRYHLTNFAHLFTYDYSAGYYFYLWSEVLDKDCFAAFKESGSIFSKSVADKLHDEVLVRGSEEDGASLYRNFRGADPSRDHLLEARGLK